MEHLQNFYPIVYSSGYSEESVNLLENIDEFWAKNKEFWFSHKPIDSWPLINTNYKDELKINIKMILHYDQIYRHPNSKIQDKNKHFAFKFATHLALKIIHSPQFEEAEEWQKVFILLTLRHNDSLVLKELALKKILKLAEENPSQLLLRFLNATIWSIHEYKHKKGYRTEELKETYNEKGFQQILEAPKKQLNYNSNHTYKILYNTFYNIIKQHDTNTIAVSISGGVDSMVAAYIAKDVCKGLKKQLILLHINYNNRDCCEDECELLRFYANKINTPLYIRKITEIKRIRNSQLRSLYEDITRKIRFSFYDYFKCPVILGHNLDDCFENVFTNLSKQIHYENLFGMRPVIEEQGVIILRPMLEIPKKDIYLFADNLGIPHLYDSTPSWSRRGQMRDKLIPGIKDFDPNILTGLQSFIKHTTFLESQWEIQFKSWIQNLKKTENGYTIPLDLYFETNYKELNFWIKFWRELSLDERPSNKSFINLTEQSLNKEKIFVLNSQWRIKMNSNMWTLYRL